MREDEKKLDQFLTPKEVMELTTFKRSTIKKWSRLGLFPRPIKLSPTKIAYSKKEVDAWMTRQKMKRR